MTVNAPYNFVPLSELVCKAREDLGLSVPPSQDTPDSGSESGVIDVTITCGTPILVNWSEGTSDDGIKRFGRVPGGTPAIPGSTLRGMIRNVLEIASFGKMALVDDARTSVRDLNALARMDYGSRMAEGTPLGFSAIPRAGWLRLEGGQLIVSPCEFARIDHSDLSRLSADFANDVCTCIEEYDASTDKKGDAHKDMTRAENVEAQFRKNCPTLKHKLWVQTAKDKHEHKPVKKRPKPLSYQRAATSRSDAERRTIHDPVTATKASAVLMDGTLVFTGMPGPAKHMEFFFLDAPSSGKPVAPLVWRKFLDVHERQEKVSETWKWRRKALFAGQRIPVFFLTGASGEISHLGLALMFKLPADNSIGDMIANSSSDHRNPDATDLAERIFGKLESGSGKADGWRSRVSFGWALATGGFDEPEDQDRRVILAKPKPGFPAAYVRQKDFASKDGTRLFAVEEPQEDGKTKHFRAQYRSYMNWSSTAGSMPEKERIRGWKRYPVGPERGLDQIAATGEGVSTLRPLRPKHGEAISFSFKLRYHNLAPVELGALIWAATWGGNDRLRHAVGMGRPLGWGQVQLCANLDAAQTRSLTAFCDAMEGFANRNRIPGGWVGSLQLRQLCAMADPDVGAQQSQLLSQMRLQIGADNPFNNAKASGEVLPEYAGVGIAELVDRVDARDMKTRDDLIGKAKEAADVLRRSLAATPRPPVADVRYRRGERVSIRAPGIVAIGEVTRDTDTHGRTCVTYKTEADLRRKTYSQGLFPSVQLSPHTPAK